MLYDTIMTDIKEAMKSHDKKTLSTLRFLKSFKFCNVELK